MSLILLFLCLTLNQFEMKNLSIIVMVAIALVASLFACQKDNETKVYVNTYENSVITEINVDSLQGAYIPIQLDWNERVLASFLTDDYTCELLVGYRMPKHSAITNFAHRKILVIGHSGHWDRKSQSIFVLKNGKGMRLVPSYPPNSASPMPRKPFTDKPLKAAEEVPLRK